MFKGPSGTVPNKARGIFGSYETGNVLLTEPFMFVRSPPPNRGGLLAFMVGQSMEEQWHE